MSSQIIKKNIPNEYLFDFLNECAVKNDEYYKFDTNSYKKAAYLDILDKFNENLVDYYFNSKQFYLTRKQSFNSLATIIRQICKKNNLRYVSKIKYIGSNYNIIYYIYY
jgi:hypothetical protein